MTTHWQPDYSQTKRRRAVLEDCSNDPFKAAHVLSGILAKSREVRTKHKAANDLAYFLRMCKRETSRHRKFKK